MGCHIKFFLVILQKNLRVVNPLGNRNVEMFVTLRSPSYLVDLKNKYYWIYKSAECIPSGY